jgi:hypothetical protein
MIKVHFMSGWKCHDETPYHYNLNMPIKKYNWLKEFMMIGLIHIKIHI